MIWPAMVFAAGMIVYPFGYALVLSLQDFVYGKPAHFVGLGNYLKLLADPLARNALWLTIELWLVSLALQLVIGTWLGLLLARMRRGQGLARTVLVSPFMLPPVVVGMMAIVILDPSFGVANWVLAEIGIGPRQFLAAPDTVIFTVAAIDTWQWAPFVALIVLGGYLSLPGELFEAAADRRRGGLAALPPCHPAAAGAHHRHRGGAAQRRPAALLRHHLHHHPGRPGLRQLDAQHPRPSAAASSSSTWAMRRR